jgi:hypothetical protein
VFDGYGKLQHCAFIDRADVLLLHVTDMALLEVTASFDSMVFMLPLKSL